MSKKKSSSDSTLSYDCLKCIQGSQQMYLFQAPAKQLKEVFSVNERDPDNETGYQRVCSPARLKAIAKFVDQGKPIPLSILVSLKSTSKVTKDGKTITIPNKKGSGWIIDGQHRLLGAARADSDISLPVVAFIGLSATEQAEQFVTINEKQKGVPTSLRYDLMKHLTSPKSETEQAKEAAVEIANDLRQNSDSNFADRIVIVRPPKKGELSLNNFVRLVYPLIHKNHKSGVLESFAFETQVRAIENYYEAFSKVFPKPYNAEDSVFFRTIGFGGAMNAFPKIFQITTTNHHAFQVKDIIKILKRIDYFDFEKWKRVGTGSKAEKDAADDLISEIEDSFGKDDAKTLRV